MGFKEWIDYIRLVYRQSRDEAYEKLENRKKERREKNGKRGQGEDRRG